MGGVRSSKVKERSGRTVTRAGIGVPGTKFAVLALNSWLWLRQCLSLFPSICFCEDAAVGARVGGLID